MLLVTYMKKKKTKSALQYVYHQMKEEEKKVSAMSYCKPNLSICLPVYC